MMRIAAVSLMLLATPAQATGPGDDALRDKAMAFVAAFVDSAGLPLGENDTVSVKRVD